MRALLLAAGLALLVHAPPAAAAAGRLDVLAQQLRERPLAVDSELSWFFDRAEEARLVRVLRRSPVDFHVALVPHFKEDESGGDGHRIVVALHRLLRRRGLYLVIDQNGYFSGGAYAIPREIRLSYGLEGPPTSHELRPGEVIDRVQRLVADVAAAPAPADHRHAVGGRARAV